MKKRCCHSPPQECPSRELHSCGTSLTKPLARNWHPRRVGGTPLRVDYSAARGERGDPGAPAQRRSLLRVRFAHGGVRCGVRFGAGWRCQGFAILLPLPPSWHEPRHKKNRIGTAVWTAVLVQVGTGCPKTEQPRSMDPFFPSFSTRTFSNR